MDDTNEQLADYTRSQIGSPFLHHFQPNICNGGNVTLESCMQSGMDEKGYDCMGLVIAGVCNILDIDVSDWPSEYRHNLQLYEFATVDIAEVGDIILIESLSEETGDRYATHSGIYVAQDKIIHANGRTKVVDEGEVTGIVTQVSIIKPVELLKKIRNVIELGY